jgi:thiol-disulfide isomerase/thioredoxin
MRSGTKIVLVALAAGALGVIASLASTGPGPLLRSEFGQRAVNWWLSMHAPAPPAGIVVAERGRPLPALTLTDLRTRPVTLPAAYAGRPLLINLWATWCAPCLQEMPELQRFSIEQAANGIQVIGIALDDPASVRAFLRQTLVTYPILLDAPGPTDAGVRLGNPKGVLPYSVLVSTDGRLLKTRIGPFAPGEIPGWARD